MSTGVQTGRKLRPREPIAAMPSHVSQLNVEPIFGINPSRYLDLLLAHPETPRACVGRLRIVAVDDLRALLSRLAKDAAPEGQTEPEEDELVSVDAVLAAMSMRRVG